jgi:hypothetical protein
MLVMGRIQESFRVRLSVMSLFEARTIEGLSAIIDEEVRSGIGSEVPPVKRREQKNQLPLSYGQERLWFINQLVGGSGGHIIPYGIRVKGEIDEGKVEESINGIVKRHEVLRTRFEERGGIGVQVIEEEARVRMRVIDLGELGEEEREREVGRLGREEGGEGFELRKAPLVRATLMRMGREEAVLLVVMHHLVTDGWSMGIFNEEFGRIYRGNGEVEELEVQYGDYAVWQREWLRGEVLERQVEYWEKELWGAARVLELPTDYERPVLQSFRSGRERFLMSEEVSRGINVLSRREGVTLYMALLGSLEVLLYRWSGQEDISIGSPVANRGRKELEGLIGLFVNMLVMRVEV